MDKVIFLGTSAGIPTPNRNVPAVALIFEGTNEFWLFDCGEGTQRQLQKTSLKLSKLTNIIISHLHGDHIFGLPGLLATRGMLGIKSGINIFGPVGLDNYLKSSFDYSHTYIPYSYCFHPIKKEEFAAENLVWEKGDTAVYCALLNHQIDSYGFAVIRTNIKRNILVEKLVKAGLPPGPAYKKFKEDGIVKLADGRVLTSEEFIMESANVKKFCYCGDTTISLNTVSLSDGADLLIHEATFCADKKEKALEGYHSTVDDALKVAKLAKVKKLVLTHISPRYDNVTQQCLEYDGLKEKMIKEGLIVALAEDFGEVKI